MHKLELFDETFDPNRTESYELSIQVSLNGFSFCINDLSRNIFIALVTSPFKLVLASPDDWAKQVDFLKETYAWIASPFKRVLFSYVSPSFAIVPKPYFDPKEAKKLLALSHQIDDLDEVWFNEMDSDIVSVFSIPSMLITSLRKIQRNTRIMGYCDSLIKHHALSDKLETEASIILSLSNDFSIVLVSKGKAILHCASITSKSIEDITFHLHNICKELSLTPNETKIFTLGQYNQSEQLELLLERFFKVVLPIKNVEKFHYSYMLTKHKVKFANLFTQSLCE